MSTKQIKTPKQLRDVSINNIRNAVRVCKDISLEYGEFAVPLATMQRVFNTIRIEVPIHTSLTDQYVLQYNNLLDTLLALAEKQCKALGVRRVSFGWLDQAADTIEASIKKGFRGS